MFASDLDAASRAAAGPRRAPGRAAQAAAVLAVPDGGAGRLDLARHHAASSTTSRSRTSAASSSELLDHLRRNTKVLDTIRETQRVQRRHRAPRCGGRAGVQARLPDRRGQAAGVRRARRAPRRSTRPRSSRSRSSARSAAEPAQADGRRRRHGSPAPGLPIAASRRCRAMKKITRAFELIAASRMVKAQQRTAASDAVRPGDHPRGLGGGDVLQRGPPADHREGRGDPGGDAARSPPTAGWPAPTPPTCIKEGEQLAELLRGEGKEVVPFIAGRKGVAVLPVPPPHGGGGVGRLLRRAAVRARQGDRRRR